MVQSRVEDTARGFWSRAKRPAEKVHVTEDAPEDLRAEVLTLAELLSGDYRFRLTCFQRSYSWRKEQVTRLLASVLKAMEAEDPNKRRRCLGRLMLAQEPGKRETELVDGHQRLMTLTIIFALLRDLETDDGRIARLHSFIAGGSHHPNGTPIYRVAAQATPSPMIEAIVQEMGGTETDPDLEVSQMSDTERYIFENRECLRAELTADGMTAARRRDLADFLADSCKVIAVIASDQDEAWDLIRTEQETRLEFTEADEAKAIMLAAMPMDDRIECGRRWEGCEAILSHVDLYRLLSHIRAIKWRGRTQSKLPVEIDIIRHFALEGGGTAFMDQELIPGSERLSAIRRAAVGADEAARSKIAKCLEYMTWVDAHIWVPAALQWLTVRGEGDAETELFFRRLERFVWIMKLSGTDTGVQETRILALLGEIERWLKVDSMNQLQIERAVLEKALANLRNRGFAAKLHAGLVLRRLSIAVGRDSGPIERDKVTIEHILPCSPPPQGAWRKNFRSKDDIDAYCRRLGNITLLTGRENNAAATHGWLVKRPILANSKFVLSNRVAEEADWTVKSIADRTEQLIEVLFGLWDLEVDA